MVIDAINQQGQHALIYGERGVGKTSLANVVSAFLASMGRARLIVPHINCDGTDDFSSIWRKVFQQITLSEDKQGLGFRPQVQTTLSSLSAGINAPITPDLVLSVSLSLPKNCLFIPIIDEFDRLANAEATRAFTDTVKMLSDQSPKTTLILVGVAGTVEELIAEHQSVERRHWCRSVCRECRARN